MADVRLTATNPEDSSVVPVACNAKGELLLEKISQLITEDLTVEGELTVKNHADDPQGTRFYADGDRPADVCLGLIEPSKPEFTAYFVNGGSLWSKGSITAQAGMNTYSTFNVFPAEGAAAIQLKNNGNATFTGKVGVGRTPSSVTHLGVDMDPLDSNYGIFVRPTLSKEDEYSGICVGNADHTRGRWGTYGTLQIGERLDDPNSEYRQPKITLAPEGNATFSSSVQIGSDPEGDEKGGIKAKGNGQIDIFRPTIYSHNYLISGSANTGEDNTKQEVFNLGADGSLMCVGTQTINIRKSKAAIDIQRQGTSNVKIYNDGTIVIKEGTDDEILLRPNGNASFNGGKCGFWGGGLYVTDTRGNKVLTDFVSNGMMTWTDYPTKKEQLEALGEQIRDEKNANSPSTQDL